MAWRNWNNCHCHRNFPILKIGGMQLFQTEFSAKEDKVLPRTTKIASAIGLIYFGLTVLCSFFLYSSGLDVFDSLAHGMTIIATGGFSTKNMSIGFFDSIHTEIVTMVFMIISSLPFILIFHCLRNNLLIFENSQVQFLVFLFFIVWSLLFG